MKKQIKILPFVDVLRVIASLLVLINHYLGNFWLDQFSFSKDVLFPTFNHSYFHSPLVPLFNVHIHLGYIGVGVFLLITGFLSVQSALGISPKKYLINRLLRIYPTYIISLFFIIIALKLNAWLYNIQFTPSLIQMAANILLLQDVLHQKSFDSVVWTLLIQVKFYLGVALILFIFKKTWLKSTFLNFGVICVLFLTGIISNNFFLLFERSSLLFNLFYTISFVSPHIIFITIGIFFYYLYSQRWGLSIFIKHAFISCICGSILLYQSAVIDKNTSINLLVGYLLSIMVFGIFYILRTHFQTNNLAHFFAQLTFPVFLLHRIIGYILLYVMVSGGTDPVVSMACVFILVITLSLFVHYLVMKFFPLKPLLLLQSEK